MKLHEQVAELRSERDSALEELSRFQSYLYGPKFQGHDSEGYPANYINTHEVLALIARLRDDLDRNT